MNTLSERLKYARRELTALKTAHPRGLGNLRVYRKSVTLTSPGSSRASYNIIIDITFGAGYKPYPFVQVIKGPSPGTIFLFDIQEFEYTNSGMGARALAFGRCDPGASVTYEILSLAPVASVSSQWEEI